MKVKLAFSDVTPLQAARQRTINNGWEQAPRPAR